MTLVASIASLFLANLYKGLLLSALLVLNTNLVDTEAKYIEALEKGTLHYVYMSDKINTVDERETLCFHLLSHSPLQCSSSRLGDTLAPPQGGAASDRISSAHTSSAH